MKEYVFAVGSWERNFVVDRIYNNLEDAISYCNNQQNDKYDWGVMKVPLNGRFIDWEYVERSKKEKAVK